ncbi:MAG: hypothetical protein LBK94_00385 [Prevotellaceae bacterium]|nr:hypothetical protein [Prevotellaceae bacterium]
MKNRRSATVGSGLFLYMVKLRRPWHNPSNSRYGLPQNREAAPSLCSREKPVRERKFFSLF